jgi:AraC-like DNA-binding protein
VSDESALDIAGLVRGELLVERYRYPPGPAVSLPRHMHEEYQLNLNIGATGGVHYRGAFHVVPSGGLAVLMPGEPDTPRDPDTRDTACTHLTLYVRPEAMRAAGTALRPSARGLPSFAAPIVDDRSIVQRFTRLHAALCAVAPELERDVRLLGLLTGLVSRQPGAGPAAEPAAAHRAVRRARDYLDAHHQENVTLAELAAVAQLSPYRLARLFRRDVGLPPQVYQRQRRLDRAKRQLLAGAPVSRAGHDAGFFDLSHFTRHFKRYVGVPPGAYAATRQ